MQATLIHWSGWVDAREGLPSRSHERIISLAPGTTRYTGGLIGTRAEKMNVNGKKPKFQL